MKYRHEHHAGNFADVHKHVTLLALLAALKRKEKGFLYFETHAGAGLYEAGEEAALGVERFIAGAHRAEELQRYASAIHMHRAAKGNAGSYPGSPLLAARELRAQDRGLFLEIQPAEARALERSLGGSPNIRVECGDGYARLRAALPPLERRGLTLIDPPYEDMHQDFERVRTAIVEALKRFPTGIIAAWYPIKNQRDTSVWLKEIGASFQAESLAAQMWLYPPDSRVALNGSGMLILNPPYLFADRAALWLAELAAILDRDKTAGWRLEAVSQKPGSGG